MFIPNTPAVLHRMSGRDAFGRATFSAPVTIKIGVVDLGELVTPSQIRADQSASRGSADIDTVQATLLLPRTVQVKDGDVIEIDGMHVQVCGVMPRRSILGLIDHYQISGNIKAGPLT